jgi:hypothetical protein
MSPRIGSRGAISTAVNKDMENPLEMNEAVWTGRGFGTIFSSSHGMSYSVWLSGILTGQD